MGAINLPANIQNGDPLDADSLMADLNAIVTQSNGLLEAASNVRVLAPPASNVGNQNSEGVSAFLSRADHQHVIQGVENVTTLPTSGNFLGRMVYVTSGVNLGKLMICTDVGAGTFQTIGGLFGTTDVPVHGVEHKDGGHDPLGDGTLTEHMFAAKTNIFSATLGSDVANISGSAFTNIQDLVVTTATGISQTLLVSCSIKYANTTGTNRAAGFRVIDVTNANTTIFVSESVVVTASVNGVESKGVFFYSTPVAGGTRTLRVQAGAGAASTIDVKAHIGLQTDTGHTPTITAAII